MEPHTKIVPKCRCACGLLRTSRPKVDALGVRRHAADVLPGLPAHCRRGDDERGRLGVRWGAGGVQLQLPL